MIRNTIAKIKKAWALALASRGRGEARRLPGKFHKLSVLVVSQPEKNPNNLEQCEKCKKLIDYIFGPGDTIGIQKSEGSKQLIQDETYEILTQGAEKEKIGLQLHKQVAISDNYLSATPKDEERLEQKVEHIGETPLVEAEKKKIDSPQKPPRVLGHIAEVYAMDDNHRRNLDNIYGKLTREESANINMTPDTHYTDTNLAQMSSSSKKKSINKFHSSAQNLPTKISSKVDDRNLYDAIAQRCFNAPTSAIDEYLLKEINNKCNTPSKNSSNTSMHKEINSLNKTQQLVTRTKTNLETNKFKRSPDAVNKIHTACLANAETQNKSQYDHDWTHKPNNRKPIDNENIVYTEEREPFLRKGVEDDDMEPRPQYDPLRPIIDPYDKRSIALDNDTFEYSTMTIVERKQANDDKTLCPTETKPNIPEPTLQSTPQIEISGNYPGFEDYHYIDKYKSRSRSEQKEYFVTDYSCTKESNDENISQKDQNKDASEVENMNSKHTEHNLDYENQALGSENNFKTTNPTEATRGQRSEAKQQNQSAANATTATAICSMPNLKEISNPVSSEQELHIFDQRNARVGPAIDNENPANSTGEIEKNVTTPLIESIPLSESEKVSLSEMLERVRLRNRIEFCRSVEARQLDPVEGKCGKKKNPPCPPPAPKCAPEPPPKCSPVPPPCPRPCKPTCSPPCPPSTPTCPPSAPKCPSAKFTPTSIEDIMFTILWNYRNPRITFEYQPMLTTAQSDYALPTFLKADITDTVVTKLKCLRSKLWKFYRCFALLPKLEDCCSENFKLARNFEPWVPIPSLPVEKKENKKPQVYPKDGCKILPPPPLDNPCVKPNDPCLGFPKRRNFSTNTYTLFLAFVTSEI